MEQIYGDAVKRLYPLFVRRFLLKRVFSIFLCILFIITIAFPVYASGNANIESGGGGLGQGTSSNVWYGLDGVRVTIVRESDNQAVSVPVDFCNNPPTDIEAHFGKVSKLQYRNGMALSVTTAVYGCIKPIQPMPTIVSSGGGNNITAIRNYFCDRSTITFIASQTGFSYDLLIGGEYKILLEPIAYFKYESVMYAMTATEAALFDQKVSGGLRSKMVSLSHKNLPLAMFLEHNELGFTAWSGSTSTPATNENIISYLGMGIIRFSDIDTEPEPQDSTVRYRTDTEIIISVSLSTVTEKTPKNPAYASFTINGSTYTHSNIYIPEGSSQLAWVKWRTPSTPGTVTIHISSNCDVDKSVIVAQIVDLNENPPPDPQANDRNDGYSIPSAPAKGDVTTLTWGEWDCWWHENWVWVSDWDWCSHSYWVTDEDIESGGYWDSWGHWVDNGEWEDHGWYKYEWIPYWASLSATVTIKPDEKSPTATANSMKSGYGFNMNTSTSISSNAPSSHITGAQNVVAYFPEFYYQTWWRLLARVNTGYNASFEFKKNIYSTYYRPVHFSPVWFPDGQYAAYAEIMDAWTPAGMLQVNRTAVLTINGNLFSDWHVRPQGN